jgi:hypothetical protein
MQQLDDDDRPPLHHDFGFSVVGSDGIRWWERVRWRIQGLLGLRLSDPRSVRPEEREALIEEARLLLEEQRTEIARLLEKHRSEIDGPTESTTTPKQ